MYKVFFNDRIVFLTNDPDHLYIEKQGMFYPYLSFENLKSFMHKFQRNNDIKQVYIYNDDLDNLIADFKACFNYLEAAVELQLVDKEDVMQALSSQFGYTYNRN
ncbi:MAG: hypothetical protein GXO79_10675, partial [Chlorobi bacterium]|nr:hypothetical protein [Chlorobiota bacterium]